MVTPQARPETLAGWGRLARRPSKFKTVRRLLDERGVIGFVDGEALVRRDIEEVLTASGHGLRIGAWAEPHSERLPKYLF